MDDILLQQIHSIKEVTLIDGNLTLEEFIAIVKYHAKIRLSQEYEQRIVRCRSLIEAFLSKGSAIYGVTTGFGDNVKYVISPEDAVLLQNNILRSHACSVGEPLALEEVRAIILMIILNTGKGNSGIKLDTILLLCAILNQDLYPFAPGNGSVGYLAVEAHICLTLIGDGFFLEENQKIPAAQVLEKHHLTPITLGCKEGLSLISGTTSATAFSLLSLFHGITAYKNIQIAAAMSFEALKGTTKAYDPQVHRLKRHLSQQIVAEHMRSLLKGSAICLAYREEKVQDPCLLRTIPQVLGSCLQLIKESYTTIIDEMQSISDNPVILPEEEDDKSVYMTGNFDGSYIGTHCDMLSIAYANLGNFVERCTDRLVNHHISNGLPPFLVTNPGLNSGFMIPQYTQAALQSELKLLAVPASVDSITTCAGQEDPVSMAYHAGYKSNQSAKKLLQMTGILLMCTAQALELTIDSTGLSPSPISAKMMEAIRIHVPFVTKDRYLYEDMEVFYHLVTSNKLTELIETDFHLVL